MKKIVYVTGSRAEFGRDSYILKAIKNDNSFELYIIATGMHLSHEFGYTIEEIEKEFKVTDKVEMLSSGDTPADMAKSLGKGIIGITQSLEKIKPDLVLVAGDRGESLAAAIAASHLNIPVAHVGGGYDSGSVDDKMRDAITTFSTIHFVANKKCRNRVRSILGEESPDIHIVGAPDLEAIRKKDFSEPPEIASKFKIDLSKPLILMAYHPVTDEYEQAEQHIKEVYESILKLRIPTIITYPNADAGGRKMTNVLVQYPKNDFVSFYKHLPYKEYLGLMNVASVIVGNSSAAIIEAPSFHLSAVNVGSRQAGRERAENAIDVICNKKQIIKAIKMALYDSEYISKTKNCNNPYGDGNTAQKVVEKLKRYFEDGEINSGKSNNL